MTNSPVPLSRSRNDRMLGGVAAGLAAHLGTHSAWVRLALLTVVFGGLVNPNFAGLVLLLYIAGWVLLPKSASNTNAKPLVEDLLRPRQKRVLLGVCAGLARYFKVSAVWVRGGMVVLTLFGIGLLVYLALWVVMPEEA